MGPPWLVSEGESGQLGYVLDLLKDAFIERIRLGLLARLPQNDPTGETTAPPDALAAMGRDRRVVRAISETDAAYAARLLNWIDDRYTTGNPFTMLRKLAEYTGPLCSFRTVDVRGNWFSRAADGTETVSLSAANWNWDGDMSGDAWSRFWVIVYPNGLWTTGDDQLWGDAATQAWGDLGRGVWGCSATPDQIQTLRFIVADSKPAGTRCINIILAFDAASFNPASPEPDGLWSRWSKNVAGVQVPARLSTARYLDGVGV